MLCIEYILLLRFTIYVLYSFSGSFSTFYIGFLFTRTVARVNTLSTLHHARKLVQCAHVRCMGTHIDDCDNGYYDYYLQDVSLFVGYWCLLSLQHLSSHQDRYPLVTVCTHCDFIVLPPLGNQAANTMPQFPTQPHYPDTELTSTRPIQLMLSARL